MQVLGNWMSCFSQAWMVLRTISQKVHRGSSKGWFDGGSCRSSKKGWAWRRGIKCHSVQGIRAWTFGVSIHHSVSIPILSSRQASSWTGLVHATVFHGTISMWYTLTLTLQVELRPIQKETATVKEFEAIWGIQNRAVWERMSKLCKYKIIIYLHMCIVFLNIVLFARQETVCQTWAFWVLPVGPQEGWTTFDIWAGMVLAWDQTFEYIWWIWTHDSWHYSYFILHVREHTCAPLHCFFWAFEAGSHPWTSLRMAWNLQHSKALGGPPGINGSYPLVN